MLLTLLKIFGNYARIMLVSPNYAPCITIFLLGFKQNKDRTGRIKTKQGITPFGTAVFYISKHPGLNLY